jgi:hypothetical protein
VIESLTFEAQTGDYWGDQVCFTILVACEDEECGWVAKGVMERMMNLLPFEAMANTMVQEFDAFVTSGGRRLAERPDIVIVAARGTQPLPTAVKHWIETWVGEAHGFTCALASVFERQHQFEPAALEIKTYLRGVAADAGIDWIESVPADDSEQYRRELNDQASTVSSTLDGIMRSPRTPSFPPPKMS